MLIRLVAATALLGASAAAFALDIHPYSAQQLSAEQQAGKPVALHFHADWCPTCRAQAQVLQQWKGDAGVPGIVLVVDYDKEKELRKELGVRMQSTLIVYNGRVEKARIAGETDATKLRAALRAAN